VVDVVIDVGAGLDVLLPDVVGRLWAEVVVPDIVEVVPEELGDIEEPVLWRVEVGPTNWL
jgi:hypothetical protein